MFNLAMMFSRGHGFQTLRPNSDVETSGWFNTPLFQKLDELVADDADFVFSDHGNGRQDFTVGLSAGLNPGVDVNHTILVRMSYAGADAPTNNTVVSLFEGGASRASFTIPGASIGTSFAEFSYTLTTLEASAIGDYTNLRIKVDYDPGGVGADNEGRCSFALFLCPFP